MFGFIKSMFGVFVAALFVVFSMATFAQPAAPATADGLFGGGDRFVISVDAPPPPDWVFGGTDMEGVTYALSIYEVVDDKSVAMPSPGFDGINAVRFAMPRQSGRAVLPNAKDTSAIDEAIAPDILGDEPSPLWFQ